MLYIGTSLGGCLGSLLANEVSEDDVMFIVTSTSCPTFSQYIDVVTMYHMQGNPYASNRARYDLTDYPLEKVTDLATRLWNSGKIHQPRIFVEESGLRYRHPSSYSNGLWLDIAPNNKNSTPAVVDAYEKYKILDALTRG